MCLEKCDKKLPTFFIGNITYTSVDCQRTVFQQNDVFCIEKPLFTFVCDLYKMKCFLSILCLHSTPSGL